MTTITTNEMIAELALAVLGPNTSSRDKYVLKQALLALVELAKSEYRLQSRQIAAKAPLERTAKTPRTQATHVFPKPMASTLH